MTDTVKPADDPAKETCGVQFKEDGGDLEEGSFSVCENTLPCPNHPAKEQTPMTFEEWWDRVHIAIVGIDHAKTVARLSWHSRNTEIARLQQRIGELEASHRHLWAEIGSSQSARAEYETFAETTMARLRSELESAKKELAIRFQCQHGMHGILVQERDAAIKRAETAEAAKDVAQEILNVVTAERRRQDRNSDYTSCCHDDPSKPCIDDTFDELDKVQAQRDRLVEALKRLHDQHHDCMFVYGEKDLEHTPECMCLAELLSSIGGEDK